MSQFDFNENYILENDRVKLRPLLETDVEHLLSFALTEPTLWQYSLTSAAGEEGMKNYIAKALSARANKDSYPFIVFDKATNAYAGSTRFYDYQSVHNTTQLGYTWYGKAFHGTGLNRNCKLLLLHFAFEKMNVVRVEFRADNNNNRSIAAMKGIGCTMEGVLRSNCADASGGRRDSIVLSILKNEWEDGKRERLVKLVSDANQ